MYIKITVVQLVGSNDKLPNRMKKVLPVVHILQNQVKDFTYLFGQLSPENQSNRQIIYYHILYGLYTFYSPKYYVTWFCLYIVCPQNLWFGCISTSTNSVTVYHVKPLWKSQPWNIKPKKRKAHTFAYKSANNANHVVLSKSWN